MPSDVLAILVLYLGANAVERGRGSGAAVPSSVRQIVICSSPCRRSRRCGTMRLVGVSDPDGYPNIASRKL